jgi:hypothetical protein
VSANVLIENNGYSTRREARYALPQVAIILTTITPPPLEALQRAG